jgi:hypothetical protein
MVASGATALAIRTGALVLPCFSIRRQLHHEIDVLEPVDPRSFESQEALLARLAATVDGAVAEHLPQLYPSLPPTPERYVARVEKVERRRQASARKAAKVAAREQKLERWLIHDQRKVDKAAKAAARERRGDSRGESS